MTHETMQHGRRTSSDHTTVPCDEQAEDIAREFPPDETAEVP